MDPSAVVFFPSIAWVVGCITQTAVWLWAGRLKEAHANGARRRWRVDVARWMVRVPYTVAMLLMGAAVAVWLRISDEDHTNSLQSSLRYWLSIDPPALLIFTFLPPLLYHGAASEWHFVWKARWKIIGLAFPVVIATSLAVGVLVDAMQIIPNSTILVGIMLGALLSATDPVAVVAVLKASGAGKDLRSVLDGESLLNDGSAFVIFETMLELAAHHETVSEHSVWELVLLVVTATVGGAAIGVIAGLLMTLFFTSLLSGARAQSSHSERGVLSVTMTLAFAYATFVFAQQVAHVSGAVAVVVLGFWMAARGSYFVDSVAEGPMHSFWESIDFLSNTVVFTYSGVVGATILLEGVMSLTWIDYAFIPLLYIILHLLRFGGVAALNWVLQRVGGGMTRSEQIVISLSGLRGSVSLIMALMVLHGLEDPTGSIAPRIALWTSGIVLLTLLINGAAIGDVCVLLGLTRKSKAQVEVYRGLRQAVADGIVKLIVRMTGSQRFPAADWSEIQSFFTQHEMIHLSSFERGAHLGNDDEIGGDLKHSSTVFFDDKHDRNVPESWNANTGVASGQSHERSFSVESLFGDVDQIQVSRVSSPGRTHKLPTFKIPRSPVVTSTPASPEAGTVWEDRRRIVMVIRRSLFEQFQNGMIGPSTIQRLEAIIMEQLDLVDQPLCLCAKIDEEVGDKRWIRLFARLRGFIRYSWFDFFVMKFNYARIGESLSTWTALWAALSAVRSRYWLKGMCVEEVERERQFAIDRLRETAAQFPELMRVFESRLVATVILRGAQKSVTKLNANGSATVAEADNLLRELEQLEDRIQTFFKFELSIDVEKVIRHESPLSVLSDTDFATVFALGRPMLLSENEPVLPHGGMSRTLCLLVQGQVVNRNRAMPNVYASDETSPLLSAVQFDAGDEAMVAYPRGSPLGALNALTDTAKGQFYVLSRTATVFVVESSAVDFMNDNYPEVETALLRWCAIQIVRRVAPRFSDVDLGDYGVLTSSKSFSSRENLLDDELESHEKVVEEDASLEEMAYKESRRFVAFLLDGLKSSEIVKLGRHKSFDRRDSLYGVLFKGTIRTMSKRGAVINAPAIFSSPSSAIQAGAHGAVLAICPSGPAQS